MFQGFMQVLWVTLGNCESFRFVHNKFLLPLMGYTVQNLRIPSVLGWVILRFSNVTWKAGREKAYFCWLAVEKMSFWEIWGYTILSLFRQESVYCASEAVGGVWQILFAFCFNFPLGITISCMVHAYMLAYVCGLLCGGHLFRGYCVYIYICVNISTCAHTHIFTF